jgi:FixJ family two-component response regulator
VVVVSGLVDVGLYLETLDQGAYDFLTPPFEVREVAHIVRCAMSDVEQRQREIGELKSGKPPVAATPAFGWSRA